MGKYFVLVLNSSICREPRRCSSGEPSTASAPASAGCRQVIIQPCCAPLRHRGGNYGAHYGWIAHVSCSWQTHHMAKGRHGLTLEQIYQLAEAQDFKCPLSGFALEVREGEIYDPTTKKRIAIDHDHESGFIRGLLIQKVNWLVDQWEQNSYGKLSMPPEIVEYKSNPPAFKVLGKVRYL